MTAKLSQNTAILLERARRFGVLDEDMIANFKTGDTSIFQKAESEHYSFDEFYSYAKQTEEDLVNAIQEGYRIKFNTVNGLNIWLENRFGLVAEKDFKIDGAKKTNIHLTENEARLVYETVAGNWVVLVSYNGEDFKLAKEAFGGHEIGSHKVTLELVIVSEYQKL